MCIPLQRASIDLLRPHKESFSRGTKIHQNWQSCTVDTPELRISQKNNLNPLKTATQAKHQSTEGPRYTKPREGNNSETAL